jgi:hypothetical protein
MWLGLEWATLVRASATPRRQNVPGVIFLVRLGFLHSAKTCQECFSSRKSFSLTILLSSLIVLLRNQFPEVSMFEFEAHIIVSKRGYVGPIDWWEIAWRSTKRSFK